MKLRPALFQFPVKGQILIRFSYKADKKARKKNYPAILSKNSSGVSAAIFEAAKSLAFRVMM